MIQLFVNNHELLLPDDFTFTLIEENPLITNNGDFTLDITLSLLESKNAIAFGFLNRLNLTTIVKTAEASMIIDGVQRIGTIAISNNTNTEVTFQFIAGNSALNYKSKNGKKIWELDWGVETSIDYNKALESIQTPGYSNVTGNIRNFVCAPVLITDTIYNNFLLDENTLAAPTTITGVERIIMQPYLLYYLNKLPTLLGFNAGENVLNTDERVLITYMINAIDSLNYSDALPDMTIIEFIEAIETTYNVWFVVSSTSNTMSIVRTKTQLESKITVPLLNVLDEYTREVDIDEKSFRFGYSKVEYDLTDSLYFKYNALSEDIIKKCTILEFNSMNEISNYILANDYPDQFIIYRDTSTDEDCFYGRPVSQDFCSIKFVNDNFVTFINKFKGVGRTEDAILTLKMRPAQMQGHYREVMWYLITGQEYRSKFQYQLPISSNTFQNAIIDNGFMKSVENGIKTTQRLPVIEIALFSGVLQTVTYQWWQTQLGAGRLNIKYPFSHTDLWPDFWVMDNISDRFDRFTDWYIDEYRPFVTTTLRLSGPNGIVEDYKIENLVDFSMKYVFIIPDTPNLVVGNLYEYNNQLFIPISFEREKTKIKGTVKCTFYKML